MSRTNATGSIKVSAPCAGPTSSSVRAGSQAGRPDAAGGSSGSGNAKYLRYVRSKFSKSRLNSVLSLTGSGKDSATPPTPADEQPAPEQATNGTGARNQLASSGNLQTELVRLERQQHLVASSTEVELLARKSQQLRLDLREPLGASPAAGEQPAPDEGAGAAGALPPAPRQLQHQQQSGAKKSNFFQGFRYTLKGRRGSKQVSQAPAGSLAGGQPAAAAAQQPAGESSATLQQSVSLSSISSQPAGSALRLPGFGASKKFRHKLLHSVSPSASRAATPTQSASPAGSASSPFFAALGLGGQQARCDSPTSSVHTADGLEAEAEADADTDEVEEVEVVSGSSSSTEPEQEGRNATTRSVTTSITVSSSSRTATSHSFTTSHSSSTSSSARPRK